MYINTIKDIEDNKNHEFAYIYLVKADKKIEEYVFEDEEVSEVKYVYFKTLEEMVKEREKDLLIIEEEFEKLFKYIRNHNFIKE